LPKRHAAWWCVTSSIPDAETIDDLKAFNYDGYRFDANLSKGNKLVFTRWINAMLILDGIPLKLLHLPTIKNNHND
jgi:hypothetical protein